MGDATVIAVTGVANENGTLLERVGFLYTTHMSALSDKDASVGEVLGAAFALLTTNPVLAAEAASVGDRELEEFLTGSTENVKGLLTQLVAGMMESLDIRAARIVALEKAADELSAAVGKADFYRDEVLSLQDEVAAKAARIAELESQCEMVAQSVGMVGFCKTPQCTEEHERRALRRSDPDA